MIKTYKAKTGISVNVYLPETKKNVHVTFTAMSNGDSVFTTADEHVQEGLEHHYRFGKLFKLESAVDEAECHGETRTVTDGEEAEQETEEAGALRKVEVTDWDSAKDYLADTYELTRTSLRSQKAIVTAATEHGIEFVIAD